MPTTPDYDAKRRAEKPWRSWYNTKEWFRLRAFVFQRDSVELPNGLRVPRCRQTGVLLTGKHPAPNSPVADHIKPHRGDRAKFFDPRNVETVSKAYHDSAKQAREAKKDQRPIGRDGWPIGT